MKPSELYWLAIVINNQLTSIETKHLLNQNISIEKIYKLSEQNKLELCQNNPDFFNRLLKSFDLGEKVEKVLYDLEQIQAWMVSIEDEQYPPLLKKIADPPPVLFVKGELQPHRQCLAIVGTRKATYYGTSTAKKLATELAQADFGIVSGLAEGIDTAAHEGALEARGYTIAVLGGGIDQIFPAQNRGLYETIARKGAIISEYPPGVHGTKFTFPKRNRIIAGIARGVMVVEAPQKSGSLITARLAMEENREVFAIPGKINEPNNYGTHKLIQDGAKLVQEVEDIFDEFNLMVPKKEEIKKHEPALNLNEKEQLIYKFLSFEPIHLDSLVEFTKLSVNEVSASLTMLEIKSICKQLPGKLFVKI